MTMDREIIAGVFRLFILFIFLFFCFQKTYYRKHWRWHFQFNFYITLKIAFYYSHFTDEKTKVQRAYVIEKLMRCEGGIQPQVFFTLIQFFFSYAQEQVLSIFGEYCVTWSNFLLFLCFHNLDVLACLARNLW